MEIIRIKNKIKQFSRIIYIINKKNLFMSRKKLPENKKKKEFTITINNNLDELLEKYIKEQNIKNKSQYIENLIRTDMKNKGENVEREF